MFRAKTPKRQVGGSNPLVSWTPEITGIPLEIAIDFSKMEFRFLSLNLLHWTYKGAIRLKILDEIEDSSKKIPLLSNEPFCAIFCQKRRQGV